MFSMGVNSTTSFFVATILFCLAIIISLGSKKHSPRACSLWVLGVGLWVSSAGFAYLFSIVNQMDIVAFWVRGCYFWGAFIGISAFYFSLTYPNNYKPPVFVRTALILVFFLTMALTYMKDIFNLLGRGDIVPSQTVIADAFISNGYLHWTFGSLYIFWDLIFFGFWSATLAVLWQKYKQQTEVNLRRQCLYMFWAITSGIVPGILLNTIFPWVGIFQLFWVGLMASLVWVSIMTYSIIKDNQMSLLVVTNELLVIALILLMFIGMFAY
jgi:hypothetical protein